MNTESVDVRHAQAIRAGGVFFLVALCFYGVALLPVLNLVTFISMMAALLLSLHLKNICRHFFWLLAVLCGFFSAVYRPADFNYPLVWATQSLYDGGVPFSQYFNIAKGLCGYGVLILLYKTYEYNAKLSLLKGSAIACLGACLIVILAFFGAGLPIIIKWSDHFLLFALVNLCLTVVAEEAFFRLLIQRHLVKMRIFKSRVFRWGPLLITAGVFSLAHGIHDYTWLFFAAGCIYAGVYKWTGRFELAVVVHFLVNIIHFLFLPYPLQ